MCVYQKPQEEHLDRQHSIPQRAHSFPRGSTRATNGFVGAAQSTPFSKPLTLEVNEPVRHHCMAIPAQDNAEANFPSFHLKEADILACHMVWQESRLCVFVMSAFCAGGTDGPPAHSTPLSPGLLQRMQVLTVSLLGM